MMIYQCMHNARKCMDFAGRICHKELDNSVKMLMGKEYTWEKQNQCGVIKLNQKSCKI